MKRKVALLFGGRGAEHAVSCMSGASILSAIENEVDLLPIAIDKDGSTYLYRDSRDMLKNGVLTLEHSIPISLVRQGGVCGGLTAEGFYPIEVALPALHGDFGEDGVVQGYLATLGIPFVGTPTLGGAIANDKAITKMLAATVGIPTLKGCLLSPELSFADAKATVRSVLGVDYPYFVKPNARGSSVGASVAKDDASLRAALAAAAAHGEILVEPYLASITELEIGYLCANGKQLLTPIGAISSPGGFYDYEEKYASHTAHIRSTTPLDESVACAVRRHALALIRLLGVRDLARIDFFLSDNGALYFNEINPFPGFTGESLYPILAKNIGFDYKTLLLTLIEGAYARGI